MKIEAVDFFYLSMPEVWTSATAARMRCWCGSRPADHVGWGECEAAPLPSIASLVCPMSHSACKPVQDSVLGAKLRFSGGYPQDRRCGARQQSRSASGRPHAVRHRHGAVGLARQEARRAGLEAVGMARGVCKDALLFGAVRRYAGRDTWRRRWPRARRAFVPPSSAGGRSAMVRCRRTRTKSPRRARAWGRTASCWWMPAPSGTDVGRRAKARLTETGARHLAGGTVCFGALDEYRALSLEAGGRARRRRGLPQRPHGPPHDRLRRLQYVQIDAGRIGGITAAKQVADYANARASRTSITPSLLISHSRLRCSLMSDSKNRCDLRISGRAESPRAGDHPRASAARRQRAGARAGRTGIGDGGRSGGAEVLIW